MVTLPSAPYPPGKAGKYSVLVTISVRVAVPVTMVTNPPPSVFDGAMIATGSLGTMELARLWLSMEVPVGLRSIPAMLVKVLPILVLLYKPRTLLGRGNTASSMQPLQAPGM